MLNVGIAGRAFAYPVHGCLIMYHMIFVWPTNMSTTNSFRGVLEC